MATGIGYDVHKLEKGYKLILGGIEIPHSKGLVGHSDADVLTHAIIDSLLGAAALGDIGDHFPDTEEKYKGIDSQVLLQKTMAIIAAAFVSEKENYAAQFNIINIDATIIAQAPKLASYKEAIKNNLAKTLKISPNKINIKATTEEHLGFTGSENGIKAVAVSVIGSN
ncbi:MAG: 2-C-methyl-D-erythritol 2,4-cyclodiphosphate synthase [Defluviitaleaceae bacterium]|nr:2-C-methyl-D-erythritol 2,4-cyclodiphosphate synthase [Defluviitaleaceae bacterium]